MHNNLPAREKKNHTRQGNITRRNLRDILTSRLMGDFPSHKLDEAKEFPVTLINAQNAEEIAILATLQIYFGETYFQVNVSLKCVYKN